LEKPNPPVATEPPIYYGQITVHHNTVWFHTSEHERIATPGECARTILKLRAKEEYLKRMLLNEGHSVSALDQVDEIINKKYGTATGEDELK
jgi:hypothetical protein